MGGVRASAPIAHKPVGLAKDGAGAGYGAHKRRITECSNCCWRPFSLYRFNPRRRSPMMRKDNGRRASLRPSSRRRLLRRQRERKSPATSVRSISKNVSERSKLRRKRAPNSRGVTNRPGLDAARPASCRGSASPKCRYRLMLQRQTISVAHQALTVRWT